jgi:hypothetical protein
MKDGKTLKRWWEISHRYGRADHPDRVHLVEQVGGEDESAPQQKGAARKEVHDKCNSGTSRDAVPGMRFTLFLLSSKLLHFTCKCKEVYFLCVYQSLKVAQAERAARLIANEKARLAVRRHIILRWRYEVYANSRLSDSANHIPGRSRCQTSIRFIFVTQLPIVYTSSIL